MAKKTVDKKIFSLDDLKPKKNYRIKVKSFNKDKKLIGESPWVIFKTAGKNQAPPNVTNLDADFEGRALVITWNGSAARQETDFNDFKVRITSPNHPGDSRNFSVAKQDEFTLSADQNRNIFGSFEGTITVTVYSRDKSNNESSGVSITAYAEVPEDPTNVVLSAATFGYNVSWDRPTFKNYDYTNIYESSTQNGTYTVVKTATGSSVFVPHGIEEVWVKVSHVNLAGAESNLVASIPPNITPIDPVGTDVNPPNDPTNLNWEDAGTESINGITTASMRAHWQVSDIATGYKVRITEDVINKENWAVYDVPASKAKVVSKEINSNIATLTVNAHSFAADDYITVFNLGAPFDGKHKVTATTLTSVSFSLISSNISSTLDDGDIVISSYTVKELYPGTQYYGAILAYDGANNLTQFVSEGLFTTSGTAGTVGSAIKIAGTTMAFGPNVSGANDGLYINSSNYWYNTGYFSAGTNGNSIEWNGTKLRLDGGIVARGGSFSGNVILSGANPSSSISDDTASLIAAPSYNIQTATWNSGIASITLQETPSPAWTANDRIVVSQASSDFDGQYTILTISGPTITFSMSSDSANVPSITNVGKVSRINKGDRVIFNAFGIQGWEDEEIDPVFSFNRNKTSKIGGWTIRPTKIFAGFGVNAVGFNSSSGSNIRIYAGDDDPEEAPFRLTKTGNILIKNPDTDNVISIGATLSGGRSGILIDDSSVSGVSNFWYLPSTVDINSNYFRVGTSTGSAIVVRKTGANTSKVIIKDYDIEGVTSIIDDSKITVNTVEIGKGVGGAGKHGIKIDGSNYWYDPGPLNSTDVVFRAGGSDNRSLTVLKNGSVSFEGETNPTGGTIKGKLTIQGTTYAFGKDVMSLRDGLYLNANNYWTLSQTGATANFNVGGTDNFISWNGTSLNIQVGGSNVATQSDLTFKADANGSAILSLVNSGLGTGVILTSAGQIYSAGKTSFNSSTAGWYLGNDSGTPRLGIGDANNYMRWNGSSLQIQGSITGSTFTGGTFRTGSSGNYIEMTDGGSNSDKILFRSGYTSPTETTPAYLQVISTSPSFFREFQLVGATVPGWSTPPKIIIGTGLGSTANTASRIITQSETFTITSNTAFPVEFTLDVGTITSEPPQYVLGNYIGNKVYWYPISQIGGGSGTTYTSADTTGIIVNNTADTIDNAGFRKVGTTTSWTATRTNQKNRITYGATLPGEGSGRSDGDIHIEF